MEALQLEPPKPGKQVIRRRTRRDPRPRFKPDCSGQLDPLRGCPALLVPADHLAHAVREILAAMNLSSVEAEHSSLGRHGYHPRHKLGVLILGSLLGIHKSTKLALALKTDAALRLVSGGHSISAGRLRAFRREHDELFADCIEQTAQIAYARGLIDEKSLAVDGMRLRAEAARGEVRTLEHAKKRIPELEAIDPSTLSPDKAKTREEKLAKHRDTVERCEAQGRTNIVATNPSASLMKFPDGHAAPGHRITVAAVGASQRIVVAVLVDSDPNDYGKLAPILQQAKAVLAQAGAPADSMLQAAADAGYTSEPDLRFAAENRHWVDVLVPVKETPHGDSLTKGYFGRDQFARLHDGTMRCPAGTLMKGPLRNGAAGHLFRGVGCEACPLKAQCTPNARRTITIAPAVERRRNQMRERMAQPDAHARYSKRMATVEPVFSNIQDAMGFRRASSRHADSITAEILLKVLAHNISRLIAAKRLAVVVCVFDA